MTYYSAEEMKKTLKDYPKFQKRLYCRGFLITNEKQSKFRISVLCKLERRNDRTFILYVYA